MKIDLVLTQKLRNEHIKQPGTIFSTAECAATFVKSLNQSVLLRGVNDNAHTLAALSNALFDAGVMPYYLHVLDRVQGAAHFMVTDEEARQIMRELLTLVSGYMVPKLAREIGGEPSKTPLDLQLRQH